MPLSRRGFLETALSTGLALSGRAGVFAHGVASGDPMSDGVLLWTRVSGLLGADVDVRWRVARDPEMNVVAGRGTVRTGPERDFTVKVEADGLSSGTTYFYQFEALGERSAIGRTRTLPVGFVESVRLAFTSCANMPTGYFNAYASIAERDDIDAVVHLGDYLYEFANLVYGDGTATGRAPVPNREALTLGDYRARHAQYKRDPDVQAVHQAHPFIVVWDDHEIANNAWRDGASNHQPLEGSWEARKSAAVRAYLEWMPIRDSGRPLGDVRIYRSFAFGELTDLVMLDTRLAGRDRQAQSAEDIETLESRVRSLLGPAQESWLFSELSRSRGAWRVIGQQVMMGQNTPGGTEILNIDQWDGYRASRRSVFDFVQSSGIDNLVVLSGDVHSSWAQALTHDPWSPTEFDLETGHGTLGVEFTSPSVTSPGPFRRFADPQARADEVLSASPHQAWVDVLHRGYGVLTVTASWVQCDWYFTPDVTTRNREVRWAQGMRTPNGSRRLVAMDGPAAGLAF